MKYKDEIEKKIKEIANEFGSQCPNPHCNNGGVYPCEPDGDAEQCEFCWSEPKSKFNLKRKLEYILIVFNRI